MDYKNFRVICVGWSQIMALYLAVILQVQLTLKTALEKLQQNQIVNREDKSYLPAGFDRKTHTELNGRHTIYVRQFLN